MRASSSGRQAKLSNRSPPFLLDRIVLCCVTTNDDAVQKCAKLSGGGRWHTSSTSGRSFGRSAAMAAGSQNREVH